MTLMISNFYYVILSLKLFSIIDVNSFTILDKNLNNNENIVLSLGENDSDGPTIQIIAQSYYDDLDGKNLTFNIDINIDRSEEEQYPDFDFGYDMNEWNKRITESIQMKSNNKLPLGYSYDEAVMHNDDFNNYDDDYFSKVTTSGDSNYFYEKVGGDDEDELNDEFFKQGENTGNLGKNYNDQVGKQPSMPQTLVNNQLPNSLNELLNNVIKNGNLGTQAPLGNMNLNTYTSKSVNNELRNMANTNLPLELTTNSLPNSTATATAELKNQNDNLTESKVNTNVTSASKIIESTTKQLPTSVVSGIINLLTISALNQKQSEKSTNEIVSKLKTNTPTLMQSTISTLPAASVNSSKPGSTQTMSTTVSSSEATTSSVSILDRQKTSPSKQSKADVAREENIDDVVVISDPSSADIPIDKRSDEDDSNSKLKSIKEKFAPNRIFENALEKHFNWKDWSIGYMIIALFLGLIGGAIAGACIYKHCLSWSSCCH